MVRKIEACGVEKDTMINNLIIRQETEEDYKKTELMIMRSFWNLLKIFVIWVTL